MSERHWKLINIVFTVAKLGNICFGRKICVRETKMFLTSGKNIFCFLAAKFVSATHVSSAANLGNICLRNNVSATMLPSLARPLVAQT